MSDFEVTLAATVDPKKNPDIFKKIKFPCYISPKLDGIRNHVEEGVSLSRKNIKLPNLHCQELFKKHEWLDGEVIDGCETDFDVYNRTQSSVMSIQGTPDLYFWVFDTTVPSLKDVPFKDRQKFIASYIANSEDPRLKLVPQILVHNLEELLQVESDFLEMGFEGICGRSPDGVYKFGRSTLNQGILWKLKRFQDDEGIVVGFQEAETNTNVATISNTGKTKRGHSQAGMVPADTLGAFLVEVNGVMIKVSPGVLKHPERRHIWDNQSDFLGKMLKYRHFPHGVKTLPRHARFIGWRTSIDL